jgi:hypothetical protein
MLGLSDHASRWYSSTSAAEMKQAAIRSKDDHLFAEFMWARRLKYAVVWLLALLLAS